MKVSDITIELPKPVIVKQTDSVYEAAKGMKEKNMRSAFVIDENEAPVGIMTLTDISFDVVAEGKNAEKVTVAEIMTKDLIICNADNDLGEVIKEMNRKKLFALPVVNGGKIVGVLKYDLALRQFYDQHVCRQDKVEVKNA